MSYYIIRSFPSKFQRKVIVMSLSTYNLKVLESKARESTEGLESVSETSYRFVNRSILVPRPGCFWPSVRFLFVCFLTEVVIQWGIPKKESTIKTVGYLKKGKDVNFCGDFFYYILRPYSHSLTYRYRTNLDFLLSYVYFLLPHQESVYMSIL